MSKVCLPTGILLFLLLVSCSPTENPDEPITADCSPTIQLDTNRGACNETLSVTNNFSMQADQGNFRIQANSIPDHKVGLFGNVSGALNPNAIRAQNESYTITRNPVKNSSLTPLLGSRGPEYSFGILLNGVELDPVAAEPFPHEGMMNPNVNWNWNLEALNVKIGLDCNSAHVQPTGKYHYHGKPTLYLESLDVPTNKMTLIGYAADGFPIYYKYAYADPNDASSAVIVMSSGYRLKNGERPGDGVTAPCGSYNGIYSADYEYAAGVGTLDEANGRTGVTPEYPGGTYYYIVTDEFPAIPRYFRGTPSADFKI